MVKKRTLSLALSILLILSVFTGIFPSTSLTSFAAPSSASFVNGTMDSEWTIINPVTTGELAYELVKGSGLKLPTQPSGMQQGTNADGDPSDPVNVFTRPAGGESWEAVAKVYLPKAPVHNYQQIAFGVYQDANNYMKVDVEYNSGYSGRVAQFSINRDGTYTHSHRTALSSTNAAFTSNNANRLTDLVIYYKIVKDGDTYTASISFDGVDYVTVGTSGQYTATYAQPKLFVAAIKDTTNSSIFDTYCEFVKVYDAGETVDVLDSALQDVLAYASTESDNFSAVSSTLSLAAGSRSEAFSFSQFPPIPYGYNYKLVSGDTNLLVANDEGVVSAQRAGETELQFQLVNGEKIRTIKTIAVNITEGTEPVTVHFNYNYNNAPAAPASFTKETVGGMLDEFPTEQTLPQYGSRQNYGFAGWYRNPECTGEKVEEDTVFTEDTELYAKWEEVPSLYKEYEDYFLMGMFADYSYNANPAEGSAQYTYNKHYNIACPSNNFKLSNMIDTNAMRNNFTAARTAILADETLSEEEKHEQIARANEQIVLRSSTSVTNQLNALRSWNNAHPDDKKYTRFHVVAWHGSQQPNQFFGNGFTGGTNTDGSDEPWNPSQDGVVASRETMKARLDNYIKLLMDRYKEYSDIIVSWDIVNEPVDDYTGQIRNSSDSSSQNGQWGRVWHDRNPARNADGSLKYTTTIDSMGVINDQDRLYDESEWMRWAFESSVKWTKHNNLNWALYVNDYMDSNKLYTKLQPTLDIVNWIRNDVDMQGIPLAYGFQGRLAYAYPTIDMLRKQADDALAITDMIGVTEADIRSDFEPNPYFNPYQRTQPYTSSMRPAWNSTDPNTAGSGSTQSVGGNIGNTVDAHNSPVRRMPEFGTGNGMTVVNANRFNNFALTGQVFNVVSKGEVFAISEQNMKNQADFVADWMDILIERADRVELYQWDNYSDANTFNNSKAAHMWVNNVPGRSGLYEKYSFFAVVGAAARDKLKQAINECPVIEDAAAFSGNQGWADYTALREEAQELLAERVYTLEDVNDVKTMTEKLLEAAASLNKNVLTYDDGSGTVVKEYFNVNDSTTVKSAEQLGFSKPGYTFAGWNTKSNNIGDDYAANDELTMGANVRLYAQWDKKTDTYTVAFDSFTNGTGSSLEDPAYPSVEVASGETVTRPAVDPKIEGKRFLGWYKDMAKTIQWDFDTPVTANMRLYAAYEELPPSNAASISVNGQPLEGFDPKMTSYTLTYNSPATENLPVITAVAEKDDCTVEIVQASSIPGAATVTISSDWGKTVTYTINMKVLPPELEAFSFGGESISFVDNNEIDVSVPNNMAKVALTAENITSAYPGLVAVDVALSPADGAVSIGAPCVATITASWADAPEVTTTYKVNFGRMTVEWLSDENGEDGYTVNAKVRFSDGKSSIRLIQAWYMQKTGILDVVASETFEAVPKHGSDLLTFTNGESTLPTEWLVERTLSKYAWDTDNKPLATPVRYDWLPPVIDGIRVGSTNLSDFDPSNLEYAYEVPFGGATPNVTASYDSSKMTVRVTQASSIPGSAVITATNSFGTASTIYKVNFTRGANPNKVTAVKATPENPLDPNDPAWDTANEILVDKRSTTNQSASIQASGKARILWDDNYLYARVEVTKNYPLNNSNSQSHLQDSVELFFSERNFRGNYGSTVANGNQYRVNYLGATSQKSSASGWTGSGRVIEGLPEGQYGYVLTYRIPWVDSNISKTPGTALGLDLQINAMENSSTRTCFAWADTTDSGYNSSNLWGEVILG